MLVKLFVGIGRFGKLWTGTRLVQSIEDTNSLWDAANHRVIPRIVDALIIERRCECGATTRKFRAYPLVQTSEAQKVLDLPTCFITAGGVGSLRVEYDIAQKDQMVWNWSNRVGGHVLLNPVMVFSGRVSREGLPAPKKGHTWMCTYSSSTLSEFVLLSFDEKREMVSPIHSLPVISLAGECPPCREKREAAEQQAALLPEPVELANDGKYCLRRVHTLQGIRYQAGCRDFKLDEALAHWREDGDNRARLFRAALLNEQSGFAFRPPAAIPGGQGFF